MKMKKNVILVSFSVLLLVFLVNYSVVNQSILALQMNNDSSDSFDAYDWYTWKWSLPEFVSTESTLACGEPSFVFDSLGNIHLVWTDDSDYSTAGPNLDIFYKRWDALTSSWTTTEVVSTESNGPGPNVSQAPSIGVDSSNNIHIAWVDETDYAGASIDYDIFYKRWDALTTSWTTTELISQNSNAYSFLPSLAIDSSDNIHIIWRDDTSYLGCGTDPDIFYRRWNSTTSSWLTTEVVSTESSLFSRTPSLAIDSSDNVHVVWWDQTDYASSGTDDDIFYKYLDASKYAWSPTEVVSTESDIASRYPQLFIDSSDNLHVAWEDSTDYNGAGSDFDIFYKRWNVLSSSWSLTDVVSTDNAGLSFRPTLTADSSGNIYVMWEDYTDYSGCGGDLDLFYKYLDTLSSSWTLTEVVSTESGWLSSNPSLAFDPSGTLHLFWADGMDYGGSGGYSDIFHKKLSGPPAAPDLAFIVPNPDEDGSVNLDWTDIYGADMYYIYRSTSYISSIEGLTPIHSTTTSEYIDSLSSTGFYYYVVVAENYVGMSDLSNCQYIEYKIPSLNEFAITFGIIGGTTLILIVISNLRKKKKQTDI